MRSSNKTTAHDIDEANQKKDCSTARVVDKELIPKQRMDSDSLSMKLPISLMGVFASGYVVSSNSNISELHREGRPSHASSQRFRTAAHRLKTASYFVNTPYIPLLHSCNGSVAVQRVRSKFEGKKHASNRVVMRILMIVV